MLGHITALGLQVKHGADPEKLHRLSQATPAQMAGPHGNPDIEVFLTDLVFKKAGGKEVRTSCVPAPKWTGHESVLELFFWLASAQKSDLFCVCRQRGWTPSLQSA